MMSVENITWNEAEVVLPIEDGYYLAIIAPDNWQYLFQNKKEELIKHYIEKYGCNRLYFLKTQGSSGFIWKQKNSPDDRSDTVEVLMWANLPKVKFK